MKQLFLAGLTWGLLCLIAVAESNEQQPTFLSSICADYTAKAMTNSQIEAVAVIAISKDMHLRMGYQHRIHFGPAVLESLRLLPAYVIDVVYSRVPLPKIIFIFDEENYFYDEDYRNIPKEPFTKLPLYPDVPITRLVFLKREDPLKHDLINRGIEPEFVTYANEKKASGGTLAEIMKFVDMENLVTTNSVFSLLDWGAAFPIQGAVPELPPIPQGARLILSDSMIQHMDDSKTFSLPGAFANDAKTVAAEYKGRSASAPRRNIQNLGLSTDAGKRLAEKLLLATNHVDGTK